MAIVTRASQGALAVPSRSSLRGSAAAVVLCSRRPAALTAVADEVRALGRRVSGGPRVANPEDERA